MLGRHCFGLSCRVYVGRRLSTGGCASQETRDENQEPRYKPGSSGPFSALSCVKVPHVGLLTDLSHVASDESCRSTVEHPFATLKYHIFDHRRLFYAVVNERKRDQLGRHPPRRELHDERSRPTAVGQLRRPSLNRFGMFPERAYVSEYKVLSSPYDPTCGTKRR